MRPRAGHAGEAAASLFDRISGRTPPEAETSELLSVEDRPGIGGADENSCAENHGKEGWFADKSSGWKKVLTMRTDL